MKILLTGASGTGKTTILNAMKGRKKITEVVRRLVKSEGLVINEGGHTATQRKVFDTYVKELEQPNYVTDRCLIDVLGYSLTNYCRMDENDPERQEFHDEVQREINVIQKWFKEHSDYKVIYFPIEFESEDDGVRSTDEEYRKETDQAMLYIIEKLGIDYLRVTGTPEERMEQINTYVKTK